MTCDPRTPDPTWLEPVDNPCHAGRRQILLLGCAHQVPAYETVKLDGYVVVQVSAEATWWCTRGWAFAGTGVDMERDATGEPVLCGWPVADLQAVCHLLWN